jgi:hypothetical protein
MFEKVEAQSATVNNEKSEQEVETKLVVAPTSHIVTPDEMFGLETLDREDITLPRVKLLQAVSDEVSNGAVVGEWLNTLSGQSYGTSFELVPVSVWKGRTYFAENRDEAPICQSADSFVSVDGYRCLTDCPHNMAWDWQEDRTPPRCTLSYNYLVIPLVDPFPVIVSLMKSSFKAGKALNTLLMAARCPAWFWVYEFCSIKQSNNKGTFYIAGVKKKIANGKPVASDEEIRQLAEQFYRMAKAGNISVDDEQEGTTSENQGKVPF